jgi:hypothetical protein
MAVDKYIIYSIIDRFASACFGWLRQLRKYDGHTRKYEHNIIPPFLSSKLHPLARVFIGDS